MLATAKVKVNDVKHTPVKRFSSWVNTAILLHLKWSSMEWSAGANSSKVKLFLKYRLNLFLSLSAVDPDANEIYRSKIWQIQQLLLLRYG